jgi:hypothetical protein
MPSFDETLAALAKLQKIEAGLVRDRKDNLADAALSKAFRDERDAALLQEIERVRREKRARLDELLRYPPFHDRHFSKLGSFHGSPGFSFEKSVFIMTKFPEGNSPMDTQLARVIDSVRVAITESGHVPRVASDAHFHPLLWDNVELYLLGSHRAVAVLESKYKPELNPNVAMEWGWMRGMGREILPLVEADFAYRRADWGGLIEHRFTWDDPDASIRSAVRSWLSRPAGSG